MVGIGLKLEKAPSRVVGNLTAMPAVKLGKITTCTPSCFFLSLETSI